MNRIFYILIFIATALATHPADAATRNFSVANFASVQVEGDMAVIIETGKPNSASAVGDQDLVGRLDLRVTNNTLFIKMRRKNGARANNGTNAGVLPVTVTITGRDIHDVSLIGDGSVTVDRLYGNDARASLFGGGSLIINDVNSDTLALNFNSLGGNMQVAGRTRQLDARISGKGALDAANLKSELLSIVGEGPVVSRFQAARSARIIVSQFADVEITGKAECDIRARNKSRVICGNTGLPNTRKANQPY